MAGDWIKMRSNLHEDPRVIQIAASLSADELHVVGLLFRAWAWADSQSLDGNGISVTESFLDRIVRRDGFAAALRKVGWLEGRDNALTFPRFAEHNGQTAKSRAVTKDRVRKTRNAASVTSVTVSPLPEKRREEIEKTDPNLAPPAARERNVLLDALCRHAELTDPLTAKGQIWPRMAKALSEIKQSNPEVTEFEISERAKNYGTHFSATISAMALAKHWGRCATPRPDQPCPGQRDSHGQHGERF